MMLLFDNVSDNELGDANVTDFRPANAADAPFLVPLIAESSGGVWPAVWRAQVLPGESTDAAAARYLTDTANLLSIANTVIAEIEGSRVGMMTCYRESPAQGDASTERSPLSRELAAALRPYRELSDPDSLFVAELCCVPESRGKGVGSQFLQQARESAIAQGYPRVTLRVFENNTGAVRLYQRSGFERVDQRPVIAHPDITVSGAVLLMACSV